MNWDDYGMSLARWAAQKSKDPSTRVGAAVLDPERRIVSTGFNGLPRGIPDDLKILSDREIKLSLVLHAEENAILFAQRSLAGCTIYVWPMPPCSRCAAKIAQVGIARVVATAPSPEHRERWGWSLDLARWVYEQAGIEYVEMEGIA